MQRGTLLLLAFTVMAVLTSTSSCVSEEPTAPASPLSPIPSTSPIQTEIGDTKELDFSLDEPLLQGDTEVSGTGPGDLAITIVDVTLMGEVLGRGNIGPAGYFKIQVEPALIANHRIGIMVDAEATDQVTEELLRRLSEAQGEGAITLPRIGRIYDAASVRSTEPK